jgi:hypothetical protein
LATKVSGSSPSGSEITQARCRFAEKLVAAPERRLQARLVAVIQEEDALRVFSDEDCLLLGEGSSRGRRLLVMPASINLITSK